MKVLLCLVMCAAAAAAAPAQELATELPTAFDYHRRVGIPEAERIRRVETEAARDPNRIVGGNTVTIASHPHQAGLLISLTNGRDSVCGASLLSNTRLVTAAHCWWDGFNQAFQIVVVLGSSTIYSGGTRITTNQVAMHGNWNPSTIANDVAIISISWVNYNTNIQPIRLPSGNEINNNFAGSWGVASGFGAIHDEQWSLPSSQMLSHVNLQVITNAMCRLSFGDFIHESTLCTSGAGGVGTCGGDSGGPLSVVSGGNRMLVGITSFGSSAGCQLGSPSAFARVTAHVPWIQQRL